MEDCVVNKASKATQRQDPMFHPEEPHFFKKCQSQQHICDLSSEEMKIGAGRPATLAALVALRRVRDPASVVTEDPHPRHPLPPTCSHTYMSPHTLCVHACEHRKTHPKRSEKLTLRCSLNGALKVSVCQAMLRKMGACYIGLSQCNRFLH